MKFGGWRSWRNPMLLLAGAGLAAAASAQSRGELLYATHCVGCHGAQMHWRDKRQATDWPSLLAQVRQWQARSLLNWSDEDILIVARHLNDTIYRFTAPGSPGATAKTSWPTCSGLTPE